MKRRLSAQCDLQEYPQYLLLVAIALELIGGVLFVLDYAIGAIFLVWTFQLKSI